MRKRWRRLSKRFRGGVSRIVAELIVATIAVAAVAIYFDVIKPSLTEPVASGVIIVSTDIAIMPTMDGYTVFFTVTLRNIGTETVVIQNPLAYVSCGLVTHTFEEMSAVGGPVTVKLEPGETKSIMFSKNIQKTIFRELFGSNPDFEDVKKSFTLLYIVASFSGGGGGGGSWYII